MSLIQIKPQNDLLEKILNASLGEVVTVLREYLNCKVSLDLIEQNTVKPGTIFDRKVTVSAGGFPLIRAIIKFDRKIIPVFIVKDLVQKQMKIGTILHKHGIPNEKNTVLLRQDEKKVFRIYEIKNNGKAWFEIYEEIRLDHLSSIQR